MTKLSSKLNKTIKQKYKTMKVVTDIGNIDVDQVFSPSKIEDMFKAFLQSYIYLSATNIFTNFGNLLNYYIVKHFSSIGKDIQTEIDDKLLAEEDRSDKNLMGVETLCNLQMCKFLIDSGVFKEVLSAFPLSELEKIYKINIDVAQKMNEQVEKLKAEQSEVA